MTAADERVYDRLLPTALLPGDQIQRVFAGEMGSVPRFTVKRMVPRANGWYVVTESNGRTRGLFWADDAWYESSDGPQVTVDEETSKNRRLGS